MDIDAAIYFLGQGVSLLKEGEAEKIQLGSFPTLKEVIDQTVEAGIKFYACDQSRHVIQLEVEDFIEGAQVVGAATLNDLVLDADATMWF